MKKESVIRRFLLPVCIVGGLFGFMIAFATNGYPVFLILGVASFGIAFVFISVLLGVFILLEHLYLRKNYPELSKFYGSWHERLERGRQVLALNDSFLNKTARFCNNLGLKIALIWLVLYLVACGYIFFTGKL